MKSPNFDSEQIRNSTHASSNDNPDISPEYVPIIAAFRQSNIIIRDTCGSRDHHAFQCFNVVSNSYPGISNGKFQHRTINSEILRAFITRQTYTNHIIHSHHLAIGTQRVTHHQMAIQHPPHLITHNHKLPQ